MSVSRVGIFLSDWIFTTNHRRLAILYFWFIAITGFTGLILATIIRLELAYPGKFFLANNAERYLTVISLHGIVMVFFVVIPVLFGAFGNFLLPTQLGIRDVAFPRLNSFMFWVTPSGFVLLLHILLFDKAYNVTYWVNYSELRAKLRRRYHDVEPQSTRFHERAEDSLLALRLMSDVSTKQKVKSFILFEEAPSLTNKNVDAWVLLKDTHVSVLILTSVNSVRIWFIDWFSFLRVSLLSCIENFNFFFKNCTLNSLTSSYSNVDVKTFFSKIFHTAIFVKHDSMLVDIYPNSNEKVYFSASFDKNFQPLYPESNAYLAISDFLGWNYGKIAILHRMGVASPAFLVENIFQKVCPSYNYTHINTLWETPDAYFELQTNLTVNKHKFFSRVFNKMLSTFVLINEALFFFTCKAYPTSFLKEYTKVEPWLSLKSDFCKLQESFLKDSKLTFFLPWSKKFKDFKLNQDISIFSFDYFLDWRELKLEREVWRSLDILNMSRQQLNFRKKYYADLFEPASITNKVSSWLPNNLIPGWAFVTPYTSRLRYTAVGKVDIALIVVFAASLGSVFSSVNYVITYRYIGAPILKNRRELRSFFVDALLVGSRMMLLANPALLIGILLLLSDRHFNTSVFDFSGGGDTILFQHLFWFFGHPEVYIIIIPCFGFMNSLLPIYLRKRLSGRLSLQFSMYTIAFMGFAVWGHHMYMVGLANSVRTLYSTMTVMISVPASTKVLHWCVTLIQSTMVLDVGFLFLINFMYFFVLGGLSGMFVAHIGFDTIFHDTFYVIGHFHVMLAGAAVSCIFAGFYFYFSAIFGVRYSRFFAYLHWGFYTSGQLLTLIPMFWLGYAGMPRRIMDYPSVFGGWHSLISSGHFLTVLSLIFFLFMILDSFYENRAPVARMRGVSRLNTRLAFYAYESRKLRYCQTRALVLNTSSSKNSDLFKFCWNAETVAVEYVFTSSKVSQA